MGRRGRKRQLAVEDQYWKLILEGIGTVGSTTPGLVRLRGSGTHEGVPYLVLDLAEGPSLAGELAVGPIGVDRALAVGEQVAEATARPLRPGSGWRWPAPGRSAPALLGCSRPGRQRRAARH